MANEKKKSNKKTSKVVDAASGKAFRRALIIGGVILLIVLGVVAYRFGYKLFAEKKLEETSGVNVEVTITEDMSKSDITDLLYDNGLIDNKLFFRIRLSLYTSDSYGILPGTYTLNTVMTSQQLIEAMSGKIDTETTEEETLGIYTTEALQE